MDYKDEDVRLYLQFLQNNIARMNSNSAQAKGWCIAIVAALLAIFADTKNELFVLLCLIPIVLFCILDALYLQQEHKFVEMYNSYIKDKENKPAIYEMPMKKYVKGIKGFLKALRSWSVILIYGSLLVVIIILFCNYTKEVEFISENENKIENIADSNQSIFIDESLTQNQVLTPDKESQ